MMFFSDFQGGYEVNALDVETHEGGTVLQAEVVGSEDAFVRSFDRLLYVVSRSFMGEKNAVTVVDPEASWSVKKQFPLGYAVNPQDLWAVSKRKAYLTVQPSKPDAESYAWRNSLLVVDPEAGQIIKTIDLDAATKAKGFDFSQDDPDGSYFFDQLYADDEHLFISAWMLDGFKARAANTECGFVPGRVVVLDLDTDEVVTVITLKGANPYGRFVTELGTDNLLISTVGSLGAPGIEPCNGVERINQRTLTLQAPFVTEAQLGGTMVTFSVAADGRGIGFVYSGDVDVPIYEVRQFDKTGALGSPLYAPGPDGFTFAGFVVRNDRGEAYVALPYAKNKPEMHVLRLSSGEQVDALTLDNLPADVALFPGTPYSR